MKILRVTDKVSIKHEDIEVIVSPLNHAQKMELSDLMVLKAGEERIDYRKISMLTLKFAIKEIKGMYNFDDTPYELQFDSNGLTDECVGELLTALSNSPVSIAINSILANKLDVELEGVEVAVLPKK